MEKLILIVAIYFSLEINNSHGKIFVFEHSDIQSRSHQNKDSPPIFSRVSDKENVRSRCDENFCDESTDYPQERIAKLLAQKNDYKEYFGKIIEPFKEPNIRITNRFNGNGGLSENMCETKSYPKRPKSAKNVDKEWVHIVNQEDHQQLVYHEVCTNYGYSKCTKETHNLHIKTSCQQKHSIVRLLAYVDKDGDRVELQNFAIPTGCVCSYTPDP